VRNIHGLGQLFTKAWGVSQCADRWAKVAPGALGAGKVGRHIGPVCWLRGVGSSTSGDGDLPVCSMHSVLSGVIATMTRPQPWPGPSLFTVLVAGRRVDVIDRQTGHTRQSQSSISGGGLESRALHFKWLPLIAAPLSSPDFTAAPDTVVGPAARCGKELAWPTMTALVSR
jgi:hypothetical protein